MTGIVFFAIYSSRHVGKRMTHFGPWDAGAERRMFEELGPKGLEDAWGWDDMTPKPEVASKPKWRPRDSIKRRDELS